MNKIIVIFAIFLSACQLIWANPSTLEKILKCANTHQIRLEDASNIMKNAFTNTVELGSHEKCFMGCSMTSMGIVEKGIVDLEALQKKGVDTNVSAKERECISKIKASDCEILTRLMECKEA